MSGLPVYTLKVTRWEYLFTEITVRKQGHGRMIFGGDGYWQWGLGCENGDGTRDHIRNHGRNINWAEWLHNSLEGWHACILHTGDEFCIHDRHPDYFAVARLWELGDMTDAEVLKLTGGIL